MDFEVVGFCRFTNRLADELGFHFLLDVLRVARGNQGCGSFTGAVARQAGLLLKFLGNGVPFRADAVRREIDFQGHDTILLIIQSDIHDEPASKAESLVWGNRCVKENELSKPLARKRVAGGYASFP